MHTHLISAAELQALRRGATPLVVFDCSFDLGQPDAADRLFAEQHIAGAQQAHLDRDLSTHAPGQAVNGGRHPLPQREALAQWLGRMGVGRHRCRAGRCRRGGLVAGARPVRVRGVGQSAARGVARAAGSAHRGECGHWRVARAAIAR